MTRDEEAMLLLDQTRYLVDDERSFGQKLTDDRKIKLSLLALVIGLGLMKLDSVNAIASVVANHPVMRVPVAILIFSTLVGFSLSILLISTERDPLTPRLAKMFSWLLGFVKRPVREPPPQIPPNPKTLFTAALSVLYTDQDEIDALDEELESIKIRIEQYRTAYIKLAIANRRVRRRLERGTLCLLCAFYSVIIIFSLIGWDSLTQTTDEQELSEAMKGGIRDDQENTGKYQKDQSHNPETP